MTTYTLSFNGNQIQLHDNNDNLIGHDTNITDITSLMKLGKYADGALEEDDLLRQYIDLANQPPPAGVSYPQNPTAPPPPPAAAAAAAAPAPGAAPAVQIKHIGDGVTAVQKFIKDQHLLNFLDSVKDGGSPQSITINALSRCKCL